MPDFDIEVRLLLEAIHLKYQHDFRRYSQAALKRRITQALPKLGCHSVSQLQERLLRDPAAFQRLLTLLTIPVSEMFRDPAYWRVLREQVIPHLRTYPSLRIWIAGCSTGEELWSTVILLHEEGLLERSSFYATDINPEALKVAREGIYSLDRIAEFSGNYSAAAGKRSLSEYYVSAMDAASFAARLKPTVTWADHSLATDEVFAEVHLVSCRNVLIYFDKSLQNRAVRLFRDALVRKGFLGLGSKESLRFSQHADDFTVFSQTERIYQRR